MSTEYLDENNLPVKIVEAENYIQAARHIEGVNYVGAVGEIVHIGRNKWKLQYSLISDRMNPAKDKPAYVSPEMMVRRIVSGAFAMLLLLAMCRLASILFGRM